MDDPTLLTVILKQTELVGLMQLLYAILLHDGPPRHSSYPPPLTGSTLSIATATIKTVNNCAIIDLKMMQVHLVLSLCVPLSLSLSLSLCACVVCVCVCVRERQMDTHTHTVLSSTMRHNGFLCYCLLPFMQACLGAEGISLEFRHIISYLLW